MVLQDKHVGFLKKLQEYGPFINLTKDDTQLISKVLYHGVYTSSQKPKLERLRVRWYGPKDFKTF